MFIIPGWIISLLTFPGVITHEFGHKLFCDLFKVKVHEVKYFWIERPFRLKSLFGAAGYVIHEVPDKFYKTFFVDVGPFIVNTILAIFIFLITYLFHSLVPTPIGLILLWLGFSIAMNSFPSPQDAKVLWKESKKHLGQKDLTAIIGFPVSIFIWISNLLSIVWFDLFYGLGLYYLTVLAVDFLRVHL